MPTLTRGQVAKATGTKIETIRFYEKIGLLAAPELDLADDRTRSCCAVDEITREQLKAVEQKIADLLALKRELSHLIEQCSQGTIADCRIIGALAPQAAG